MNGKDNCAPILQEEEPIYVQKSCVAIRAKQQMIYGKSTY